ncbi:MAG: OsmC family protein [Bacteroidales bacterium]|jgi:ribosomal protein S12 methylthiotransferase accessory factor|nr:OsmC family protein [Bacteroidales bacterium]NLD64085.1 osmotically inducible protein C [Bacteroidales bacterium]HOO66951.1 OsmC family protein [Bacteroidales bacterium]HPE22927.1 OsmC family protein [Bacteroidales bacterium]HPJ05640.1 OsmC family protein [Bacteroidales bacterium]
MAGMEVTLDGGKVITAHINGKSIKTDQSARNGGGGSAPEPFELFLASIGTCAGIYVKSFCDQRNIPTEGIRIIQSMEFDTEKRVPSLFKLDIQLPADFPEKYRAAVINAAELCLVKKTINASPVFEVITSVSGS